MVTILQVQKAFNENKEKFTAVEKIYSKLKNYCTTLYLGGSWVSPVIQSLHDLYGIWFCSIEQYFLLAKNLEILESRRNGDYCATTNLKI